MVNRSATAAMTQGISCDRLIEALAAGGAKAILRRYFREDSCINSTRVLLEVFRALRLDASPFSVRAMIFSGGFAQRAGREMRLPDTAEELRSWLAEPNVYSVGLGFGGIDMPKDGWPGHLVLRAGQDHLLDSTIGQASRPSRGIHMPEMLVLHDVPERFWRGRDVIVREMPDGSIVRYEPRPRNNGYLGSPGWQLRPGIEEAAYREIIAALDTRNARYGHRAGRRAG